MPQTIHCSLVYHDLKIETVPTFANGVSQGVYQNSTIFTTTPFKEDDFNKLITDEEASYAAYKQGGKAQKANFNIARSALFAALDSMANYVDSVANGDENIIMLSGFVPTTGTGGIAAKIAQATAPQKVVVSNGISSGEIDAECESFHTGHHYGCIVSEGQKLNGVTLNPQGQLIIEAATTNRIFHDVNDSRKKRFTGLTKGVDYYFYFYVVSSGGVSPLSVAVDRMSL